MISFSQKALQRYTFLRTQPNKMHKNSQNVHTLTVLCNNNSSLTGVRVLLNQISQDVACQLFGSRTCGGTGGILYYTTSG